jgi:hypothetical protein
MITTLTTVALDGVGFATLFIGAMAYLKSTTRKVNDDASVELIANLTKLRETDKEEFNSRLKLLEAQHFEDAKMLANMQGQIATYKELPLERLAKAMETMAIDTRTNAVSNTEILATLKKSAIIAATDRGVLTGASSSNQTVAEQIVEHQTITEVG